jgi:hypothetical protein
MADEFYPAIRPANTHRFNMSRTQCGLYSGFQGTGVAVAR